MLRGDSRRLMKLDDLTFSVLSKRNKKNEKSRKKENQVKVCNQKRARERSKKKKKHTADSLHQVATAQVKLQQRGVINHHLRTLRHNKLFIVHGLMKFRKPCAHAYCVVVCSDGNVCAHLCVGCAHKKVPVTSPIFSGGLLTS